MAFRSDLVPPGTHIAADLTWDAGGERRHAQLRILGDDTRGYLLMGAFEVAGGDELEFWFTTLEEAKDVAAGLGVQADGWSEVSAPNQVQ